MITVTALYKFVSLPDFRDLQPRLAAFCKARGIMGTLLLAKEGINGTVAGSPQAIAELLAFLKADPRLADLEHKESFADENPFYRMKVRLKREIVTMGVPDIDPRVTVGTYVEPKDWNTLISDPDTVLIDTRNDYEVAIGTFQGAIDPKTTNFREFPAWFEENRERFHNKPKIAMFCTGGIRCEKSTALLKSLGYEDVFHLKGGILKYLETVPQEAEPVAGRVLRFRQPRLGRARPAAGALRPLPCLPASDHGRRQAVRHIHERHLLPALPRHDERGAQGRFRRKAEADGACRRAGRTPRRRRCRCGARAQAGAEGSAQGAGPGGGEGQAKGSHAA